LHALGKWLGNMRPTTARLLATRRTGVRRMGGAILSALGRLSFGKGTALEWGGGGREDGVG
jgi:hypothetical protein